MAGEDVSPKSNHQSYPTHFRCKKDPEKKRKFNPWAIEKSSTQEIGSQSATIRSNNESEFFNEISTEKKQKSSNSKIDMFSTIPRKGLS